MTDKETIVYLSGMEPIASADIQKRIESDNPWWFNPGEPRAEEGLPRRVYFDSFRKLALDFTIRRATVLLGPRRVGKTVLVKQLIHEAVKNGVDAKGILYASIDAPIYSGMSLEKFLSHFHAEAENAQRLIIFDEIQYLNNWEKHLKDLVDRYPQIKFVVTGSAAAALKLKSDESGAGRFSEFMLPPLTFYEFLLFSHQDEELIEKTSEDESDYKAKDINLLNKRFIDYLNYGGYPEVVVNPNIRQNPEQFIRSDIVDKVLLKDLPSLYGINEIQELNKLFSFLAYNTGREASLENISQVSGLAKPTIRKYIEYLESAFLVIKLTTVDDNCKTMKRARNFKIYLNNPSMRAALFGPVGVENSDAIGHLTESAIFSQWQHSAGFKQLRYARWRNDGEVDIVYLGRARQTPLWIGEIKWSDRIARHMNEETKSMQYLLRKHKSIDSAFYTTKTLDAKLQLEQRNVTVRPSALYCYTIGRNTAHIMEQG